MRERDRGSGNIQKNLSDRRRQGLAKRQERKFKPGKQFHWLMNIYKYRNQVFKNANSVYYLY